ncbi:hypothetical protein N473_07730 [Pseudoalteromonas luteoviolacea CPMOR-1]|uniref:Fibrinogen C-terminal domain-containing protein n=1 Tax=Pseudoalteromonas luteoviolacea CPMOR-1 TaxID=1365248 RepID=A0A162BTQ2_9GAMM|nr:fibrinogen-like YCDxxxxGGGW domain-containing protein [Pseudoalteromonas luteoviolacea]KZN68307.1 hypothetical protein N473_07730 [Pseudoalteromonas luteoviolacea CPMOR-1]
MFKLALLSAAVFAASSVNAVVLVENTVSHNGVLVPATSNEVVVTGVASNLHAEPGAVSLKKNSDGSFSLSYKEWEYLDGTHTNETISTLTLGAGIHTMADGSIWEVGVLDISTASQTFEFSQQYDQVPYLFLSPQSDNSGFAYVARANNVNQIGFNAKIQYQELQTTGNTRVSQKVAYLAVYAPNKTGQLDSGQTYNLNQAKVNEQTIKFENHELFLQEEQSKDAELTHIHEVVNMLDIDGHLFAQDITTDGSDTVTIRANKNIQPVSGSASCKMILEKSPDSLSGYYTLDPDGVGGLAEFTTFCDMENQGGGWTLMAIRYVPGKEYSSANNYESHYTETQNITSFVDNFHLTDPQWFHFKNNSQEMMLTMRDAGYYGIADISKFESANCIPLQDTLGLNHGLTGESIFRLYWFEDGVCDGKGGNFSMLNYANIYGGTYFKSTNIGSKIVGGTTYIFVR